MDRIFYKTLVRDPITNYPIYIFDTSYLPSPDIINYDEFILTLMNHVPTQPYILIMFNCGLNKISWVWGIKFLKSFVDSDNHNLNNVIKIFAVHDSWFIKSITEIVYNFNSTKKNLEQFNKLLNMFDISTKSNDNTQVIHCDNLNKLSHYLDITRLKISLNVYKHDLQLEPSGVELAMRYTPVINPLVRLDRHTHETFHHHLYQIFNIIDENGDKVELIFHKPGNKQATEIFFKCIMRNQLIWINDFDLYCISGTFKKLLSELPYPLLQVASITLPIQDNTSYTKQTLANIIQQLKSNEETRNYDQLLLQLFNTCYKLIQTEITKHTPVTLSNCLAHCLSHELISTNQNNVQIVKRFIKNVLEDWSSIRNDYHIHTITETISGSTQTKAPIPTAIPSTTQLPPPSQYLPDTSYDQNYDLTIDDTSSTNSSTDTIFKDSPSYKSAISSQETLKVELQFPPQKYKFSNIPKLKKESSVEQDIIPQTPVKKPVIRGRKVSELARLFEERSEGLEILKGM
ncbi:uncharacterized protein SPAPADRAFT_67099 [Spathaspora passalidarum NRRL Y-27907]|uniref:Rho-GAP domain-containing protein n=1 Tax=Spathaspora passalidarum (strain NRRL Y-27907 / 11-Y1) TaxID=619300 RepID=G3ANA4_SPAPN|nr:uncharacterized protein SPAPADRAFT_67099 [Spathaspora passalidarum NRRL Y-27907]EGW32487.1 hypothetical protein SPAPADRAFT_67099 [Spathaspora passalidarum NRRL Y-27907]